MSLVAFALRRPITILVLVIAAILTSLLAIERMPRDIFPNLGVPVLYVAQPFGGMDPAQMRVLAAVKRGKQALAPIH
jgi:multidrug efflux pump subunit AcrB